MRAGEQYREQQRQLAQFEVEAEVKLEAREAAVRLESEDSIRKLCSQLDDARAALQVSYC